MPNCKHKWKKETIYELYNKHGECVEGYGHTQVFTNQGKYREVCIKCGWVKGCNPGVLSIPPKK